MFFQAVHSSICTGSAARPQSSSPALGTERAPPGPVQAPGTVQGNKHNESSCNKPSQFPLPANSYSPRYVVFLKKVLELRAKLSFFI